MHRFFVDANTISNGQFSSTDKELCHQVSKVLKMRVGKPIILCDDSEHEYQAEWTLVSRSDCQAKILEKTSKTDISTDHPVHLFVPPLKNQARWELILEKGTELGVASFTPLITKLTEVTELRKLDRLQRIIKEAAEQSGRTKLPVIHDPVSFEEKNWNLESGIWNFGTNLIATLHSNTQNLYDVLNPKNPNDPNSLNNPIRFFIGPVGDFTEEEVEQATQAGFLPISLGRQILRTETAAITAAALVLAQVETN